MPEAIFVRSNLNPKMVRPSISMQMLIRAVRHLAGLIDQLARQAAWAMVILFLLGVVSLPVSAESKLLTDADLLNPKTWESGTLPGEWKPVAGAPNGVNELVNQAPLFGHEPWRVVATWGDEGTLLQVSILYAEGPLTPEATYTKLRTELKETLVTACGPVRGVKGLPRQEPEAYEFRCPAARVRLIAEVGRKVSVTLIPAEPPKGMSPLDGIVVAKPPPPVPLSPLLKLRNRVQRLPNDDVVVGEQPTLDEKQPPLDDPEVAALVWLARYAGWKTDIVKEMKNAGYEDPGGKQFVLTDFLIRTLPGQHSIFVERVQGFDFDEVRGSIELGQPVLVWRAFTDARSDFHAEFLRRWKANPTLLLPSPKKSADSIHWPVPGQRENSAGSVVSMVSVITGYNAKRGEVIFDEFGFGPDYKGLRMTKEEMKATVTHLFYFK